MTSGAACSLVLAANLAFGGLCDLFDCLKKDRGHDYRGADCCRVCLGERRAVLGTIAALQRHPSWRERDDAARDLRRFDWRCHPEIAPSLALAVLHDRHEEVREEAAESLAKLAPCDGSAHVALIRAADCDPDHATRFWARKALRRLDHRCVNDCTICGPVAAPASEIVLAPRPTFREPIEVPPSRVYGAAPLPAPGPPYGEPAPRVYEYDAAPPAFADPSPAMPPLPSPMIEGRSSMRPSYPERPSPDLAPRVDPPVDRPSTPGNNLLPPALPPSSSPFINPPSSSLRRDDPSSRPEPRRPRPILTLFRRDR